MESLRTILADDHRIFIEGLKAVLKREQPFQFELAGVFHNGQALIDTIKSKGGDLLILDLNIPEKDGLEVIKHIRKEKINIKILVLTMYDDPKIIKLAFKHGADGYILKDKRIDELFDAVDTILKGDTYLGEGVITTASIVSGSLQGKASSGGFDDRFIRKHNLTKREIEILRLITLALSNKEIAKELFISDQTVSVHRKNIMRKLGVSNTAGLIKVAYDNSLVN